MRKIVLATLNAGKARELSAMVAGLSFEIVDQGSLGIPAVEETGRSFVENAMLKARHAAEASGLRAIADDSGLEVDALGGAPGIHSARYAGPQASDRDNLEKLLRELKGLPEGKRGARFRCAIAYLVSPQAEPKVFEAVWEGRILESPRGANGFGYDPVFFVPEKGCASAELPPEVKNKLSHRGQAFVRLASYLKSPH